MLRLTETLTVKYKPHGILKKIMRFMEKKMRHLIVGNLNRMIFLLNFENTSLIYVLDELSIEGLDLVCYSEQEGFILRKKEEEETTINFYEDIEI